MGLYNFQPRFEVPIMAGTKTHTIRATRAHPDKPGNTLHLYVGLRHKGARLLMRVRCTRVEEIFIGVDGRVSVGDLILFNDEKQQLARRDGFKDFAEMMQFWEGRLPFTGQIIHWRKP